MSAEFLLKTAAVIEELAARIDSEETAKTASVREARTAELKQLAEQYNAATGEELEVDKLASLDETALSTIKRVVEKTAGVSSVSSMGGPSDRHDGTPRQPRTKKEAAAAADDRFTNWILNG